MSVNIGGSKLPIEELHFSFITNKLRTEYGFIESSKKNIPVNNKGEVMPMYTYPCYEYINSLDLMAIFNISSWTTVIM